MNAKGHCKSVPGRKLIAAVILLILSATPFLIPHAHAEQTGGQISAGTGVIAQAGATTTVTQSTQNLAINWQSFSIGSNEAVHFIQPNASSIALNRVLGQDPSSILGSLTANGQVFVLNPNGVLFGTTAQVNVGGLVASTLSLSDADFMAGHNTFSSLSGQGQGGSVVNQGTLTAANGGYIALLAPEVRNEGVITATLGTALLAAGDKVTLNLNNGSLLSYSIDQGSLNALAENKQLIQADGGQVYMSARAADALSTAVVNNTGIIEARSLQNHNGTITLLGDMQAGTVNVGGTLDASAPDGGNGGFIETSAAHVHVASDAKITTQAAHGTTGNWLIDPVDFTIAATGGDITGATLSTNLGGGNVQILSSAGTVGGTLGDINVNDAVSWTANTTLTLSAFHDVNVNQPIDANVGATGAGSVVLRADNTGNGPGAAAGTVNFAGAGAVALNTGTANIFYNPSSYAAPTNYATNVTGGSLNSYMLVFVDNTSATAQNKTYDGNTSATLNNPFTFLTGPDGTTAGQVVSLSAGAADFNSKDVATATTVNFTGYGLSGTDASLYSLFGQAASQAANITPYVINLNGSRNYDTTATVNAGVFGTVYGVYNANTNTTENLTLTGIGSMADKNVGTAKPVTVLGSLALSNGANLGSNYPFLVAGLASNYTLVGGTHLISISAVQLTVSGLTAANKVYDGTTTATLVGTAALSSPLGGDTVNLIGTGTGVFNNKNVGTNTPVTVSGYSLSDSNYILQTPLLAASITPAPLTFTGTPAAVSRVYDGTAITAISGMSINNPVSGDAVSLVGIMTTPNVGTGKVATLALTGASAANYSYTLPAVSLTADITQRALTYTGTPVATSRVYDGTLIAATSGASLVGVVNGDSISLSGLFADKNIGTGKTVSLALTGQKAANYSIAPLGGLTADITALALTGTASAANKVYDGTTIATISGVNGLVSGDAASLVGTFSTPNVGTGISVSVALTGADAGNYIFTPPVGLTANITPRNLVVSTDNKTMMFGGTIPDLTYSVGGAGLAGTDTKQTVFSGLLAVNMTGSFPGFTAPITQGTLVLTVSPGGNYVIGSFVDGVLTVQ